MTIRIGRLAALASTTALVVLGAATLSEQGSASAQSSPGVVVHGTAFPDPARAGLSLVGCAGMYDVAPETPQPMIGQGPGDAPLGDRSLAYDLTGGNAIGPAFRVSSIASVTTASVTVHPWVTTSTGVGYVVYGDPADADRLWVGRTELSAPGGAWTTIDVADRTFSWTPYDATTLRAVGGDTDQSDSIGDFAAQHGDGPGAVTVGFGCNGVPFNLDDLDVSSSDGSTTYDLEGLTTSVEMNHHATASGGTALLGELHSDSGAPLARATLRLERAESPDGPWSTVGAFAVQDGVASSTVQPEQTTWYRWRFVDRPLASGSTSSVIVVDGSADGPTATATASPSDRPSQRPSSPSSQAPSSSPTPSATEGATDPASESASTEPTARRSDSASTSDQPSATPSDPDTASTGAPGSPLDGDSELDQPTSSAG